MNPVPRTEGRLRLTILGGFLGSGKTTWLRHQLHAGAYPDAHIIVNEAAETPVDDALLAHGSAALTVLAETAVRTQVVLLTHHHRVVELVRDVLPGSTPLELTPPA